jgi:hypothetical protein
LSEGDTTFTKHGSASVNRSHIRILQIYLPCLVGDVPIDDERNREISETSTLKTDDDIINALDDFVGSVRFI